MEWLAIHGFVVSLWATILWGSIRVLDRHNAKNRFGVAVGLGVLFDLTHIAGVPDLVYFIAWLVFLARFAMWHYGLTLIGAVVATAATVLAPQLGTPHIVAWVGDSALRDDLVLYGLPIVVFGIWLGTAIRNRLVNPPAPRDETADPVPPARIWRWRRAQPAAPPPVAAPVAITAPPPQIASRTEGDPTLLT